MQLPGLDNNLAKAALLRPALGLASLKHIEQLECKRVPPGRRLQPECSLLTMLKRGTGISAGSNPPQRRMKGGQMLG